MGEEIQRENKDEVKEINKDKPKETPLDDEKKGVVGIHKKIVLTGLDPNDPIHKMVRAAKMTEWMPLIQEARSVDTGHKE